MSIKGRAQAALTSHRCIRRQKESIAATYIYICIAAGMKK